MSCADSSVTEGETLPVSTSEPASSELICDRGVASNPMEGPRIADDVTCLIGRTPMVRSCRIAKDEGCVGNVLLKLESMQPGNSVKDRIAQSMIEEAEARGRIRPGYTTLVEPTSGNTGIGMAMIAAAKGYSCILVMPETMSMERRILLKAFGGELILTPAGSGVRGAIAKAEEIVGELGDQGFCLQQFCNPDNPKIHREKTGPEIWWQTEGSVGAFVAGVGTGGTVSGCGEYLKSMNPSTRVVAVEPAESAVLSGEPPGAHKIMGIGAGLIPPNFNADTVDEIVKVDSARAIAMARRLALEEGLFVGISSGAAMCAAVEIAKRPEYKDQNVVAILPSYGERYLSTVLFKDLQQEAMEQLPVVV